MEYRKLGKSDLNISRIGFGSMSLKNNQLENKYIINQAIESGINYFDTADLYDNGMNEVSVGKALKQKRSKVIIATKVGNQLRGDGSGWDWNASKAYILTAVEKSLSRLQTDYIDLYQLHGGTMDDPMDETIEAFEQLKAAGKIRYYGLSSIRPNVIREYVKRSGIVSVMMQYSLLDRRPEEAVMPLLLDNKIGVLARGSVAGGLLAGKPSKTYLQYNEQQVINAATTIEKIAGADKTIAQTAIQFVMGHPAVTAAVVGIRTPEQLKDAVETLNVSSLNEEQLSELKTAIEINKYKEHR
jgi:aryl-alcohol dehydrogenase-like predicted oxidoreductase